VWFLPPRAPHFEAALRDVSARERRFRLSAAERLAIATAEEHGQALAGLYQLFEDPDPDIAAVALHGLATQLGRSSLDFLAAALDDPRSRIRQDAIKLTANVGGASALVLLRSALQHKEADIRFQAISAAVANIPRCSLEDLRPLLRDSDPWVVGNAVHNVQHFDCDAEIAVQLQHLLTHTHAAVRAEAALSLAIWGNHRGEANILKLLDDPQYAIEAMDALVILNSQPAREALLHMVGRWLVPLHVRIAAIIALHRLNVPEGTQRLRKLQRSRRKIVRILLAQHPFNPTKGLLAEGKESTAAEVSLGSVG